MIGARCVCSPTCLFSLALIFFSIAFAACQKASKIDLRSVAPKDALVYLETNDLAAALEAETDNQAFQKLARDVPNFSDLKNIQMAIIITGFGTSADEIGAEQAVLNFKPQFVAVAETDLWNWQAKSLVENQVSRFVGEKLGADARLEISDKYDGKFYVWNADDKRQIFALVQNSLIYFGNDEQAIEQCAAAKKGAIESLQTVALPARNSSPENLAFGYVSPAGAEKIADLAGVFAAASIAENSDERNFIAQIVPRISRDAINRIVWTEKKTDAGIEDEVDFFWQPPFATKNKENFAAINNNEENLIEFLPADFFSATRYRLKNPLAAWQQSISLAAEKTDALRGKLLVQFSNSLLESYGIADAQNFLSAVDSEIVVARFDENGDRSVIIVKLKNPKILEKFVTNEINFISPPERFENAEIRFSGDKATAAALVENILILGDAPSVRKCLQAGRGADKKLKNQRFERFADSVSPFVTFGQDSDSADRIARVLTENKSENTKLSTFYTTETNIGEISLERRTVSDFGLLGTILKQLEQ